MHYIPPRIILNQSASTCGTHLLNLPLELRQRIVKLVLSRPPLSTVEDVHYQAFPGSGNQGTWTSWKPGARQHMEIHPPFMQTCRQLYTEGLEMVCTFNVLRIVVMIGAGMKVDVLVAGNWFALTYDMRANGRYFYDQKPTEAALLLLRQFHNFEICLRVEGHNPRFLATGIGVFSDWFHVVARAGKPKAKRITLDLQKSGVVTEDDMVRALGTFQMLRCSKVEVLGVSEVTRTKWAEKIESNLPTSDLSARCRWHNYHIASLMQMIQKTNGSEALEVEAEFEKTLADYDEDRYLELERDVKQRFRDELERLFKSWRMARSWNG